MQHLTDDQRESLIDFFYQGIRLRQEAEGPPAVETAHAWKKLSAGYDTLPEWLEPDALADVEGYVHPRPLLERLLEVSTALSPLCGHEHKIRLAFYRKPKNSKGVAVWGRAAKVGAKERDLAGGWWWDIELSLIAWALLGPLGRARLLHHELSHLRIDVDTEGAAVPALQGHTAEVMAGTLAELGPLHHGEVTLGVLAMRRREITDSAVDPRVRESLAQRGLDVPPIRLHLLEKADEADDPALLAGRAAANAVGAEVVREAVTRRRKS